jgi:Fe-S-cluster containining protein
MRLRPLATPPEPTVTLTIGIEVEGARISGDYQVPAGPVRPRRLLPVVQALSGAVIEHIVRGAEREGRSVSCRAHCGACCRQLVPVSRTEAHAIRELVEDLPEPRRSVIEARFADARRRLEEAGLLERVLDPPTDEDGKFALGMDYFAAGIPCPFLEDESCSIHPERPVICREYLVTSPPEHCARPTPETVAPIAMSTVVSQHIPRMEASSYGRGPEWVALVLAPAWAEEHPEEPPMRTGPQLLAALLAAPRKPAPKRKDRKKR